MGCKLLCLVEPELHVIHLFNVIDTFYTTNYLCAICRSPIPTFSIDTYLYNKCVLCAFINIRSFVLVCACMQALCMHVYVVCVHVCACVCVRVCVCLLCIHFVPIITNNETHNLNKQ